MRSIQIGVLKNVKVLLAVTIAIICTFIISAATLVEHLANSFDCLHDSLQDYN